MTVQQLRASMGAGEFLLWSRWFVRRQQEREVAAGA